MARTGSPTWIAASPMPGAAYMVSSMSSKRARKASSTPGAGFETAFSRLSGTMRISRTAMAAR